ncbi:MAG TPA: DUF1697 domain-containing protein [Verrucomicrobiae bacterium]|jgi:uncharacterized protein (DUF1697 family)
MKSPPAKKRAFIALLRGINVSGRNMIPMIELRALCAKLKWGDVQTYIQSGNVIFTADSSAAMLETELERGIEKRFGFPIPVIVRAAVDWPVYMEGNPFPEVTEAEGNRLYLVLSKAPPKPDAAKALQERAAHGEHVRQVGGAVWIRFCASAADSKLSPALLDRLTGSTATARNWRTVLKLHQMSGQAAR